MNIVLSNASQEPLYEQVLNQIRNAIVKGELEPGDPLPSIRSLAKDLQISVITTKRAYDELEREGLIETVVAKGSFVSAHNQELLREKRLRIIEEKVKSIVEECKLFGVDQTTLHEIMDVFFKEEK